MDGVSIRRVEEYDESITLGKRTNASLNVCALSLDLIHYIAVINERSNTQPTFICGMRHESTVRIPAKVEWILR
jgi:hypothetical protein